MLYWLLMEWTAGQGVFNVFRYITFRSGLAALTAFLVVLSLGAPFIALIKRKQYGQAVRDDGPQSHLSKKGTPTMGGVLIVFGFSVGTLLWADLSNLYVWFVLFLSWGFGWVGYLDDYLKVIKKDPKGLASRWKFRGQYLIAAVGAIVLYKIIQHNDPGQGLLYVPFFKNVIFDLGPWFVLLAIFVIVGTSNAVNLTDGLDGLAVGPSFACSAAFFVICYLSGNKIFADYLQIPFVPGVGELAVYCAALCAACMAFLWFNTYPAQIFMGDVGSLALGGAISGLALAAKSEILLVILGGVFVFETVSVMMQVFSFKLTGKRVFRMAPIHHHYELKGLPEPKIIVRFWIVSIVLAVIALSTLKLR